MKDHDKIEDDSGLDDLNRLGRRISALSRPTPPENLAAKTVAYVQKNCPPKKPVFWLLRPITNPAARVAAAAVIVLILSPLTDLETGASIGMGIEQRIIGSQVMDKVEVLMDPVLRTGDNYSQPYFDSFMGVNRPTSPRKPVVKQPNRRV